MKPHDSSYFDRDVCRPFYFEGNENGILLMHGFTGSVAHMRPLGEALYEKGYTVMGVNLPGHATTEGDMAQSGWQQWLEYARQSARELRESCDALVVCGLSMGGLLSLLLAADGLADACVPISAPMATRNKLLPLAGILAPIYPRVSWHPPKSRRETLNPDYDFGYSGFPTCKAADLQRLITMARKSLARVICPTLCVQSKGDETVWAGSSDYIMNGVSAGEKEQLWLREAPHVCTLSKELPVIVDRMGDFLVEAVGE